MVNSPLLDSSATLRLLEVFLCAEVSAVADHLSAIDTLHAAPLARVLRHNLCSHEDRVRLLTKEILRLGGIPSAGNDVTPSPAPAMRATAFDIETAVALLEAGETRGRDAYLRELETVDPKEQPFVRWLLSEQRDSRALVLDLKAMMAVIRRHD